MRLGKNIRLYLVDGDPNGLTIAEIMNWTGHVIQSPRSGLPDLLQRPEVSRTGVYILVGDDPDNPEQIMAYIGESDLIDQRLRQHNRPESNGGKDFWNKVIIITSKDANLTKGHVRFLESKLVEIALRASRARLLNQTSPNPVNLPEADEADMGYFLEQVKIILPVLGLDMLREVTVVDPGAQPLDTPDPVRRSPIFELRSNRSEITATAQEADGEFIVMQGSYAKKWMNDSIHHSYRDIQQSLIEQGKLVPSGESNDLLVFAQNIPFRSPSAASAVVFGRTDNGRLSWVTRNSRQSYADWQASLVD